MSNASSSLRAESLRVAVPGRTLVDALDLDLRGGELLAVLGQNGVGKSLTLHTLAGLRPAESGSVSIDGIHMDALSRQQVARKLALLPQYVEDVFPSTVLETAMIGRHPHIGRWRWETPHDRDIAISALHQTDLAALAERDVTTLSGGERRRLAVAQVLTQAPQIYLLDEPTNHLDPQHQLDVLDLFRRQAESGALVVASLHDVNLAARYATRCLLLYGDGRWELGDVDDVLEAERLTALYATPMEAVRWHETQLFVAGDRSG